MSFNHSSSSFSNHNQRYLEFRERLADLSDHELLRCYNREVNINAWVSSRGIYLMALRDTLEERGFDLSMVVTENCFSMVQKVGVYFDGDTKVLIPVY
jgi:hypothetical protein